MTIQSINCAIEWHVSLVTYKACLEQTEQKWKLNCRERCVTTDDGLKPCSRKSPTGFYERTLFRTDVEHRRHEILFDDEGIIVSLFFHLLFCGGREGASF